MRQRIKSFNSVWGTTPLVVAMISFVISFLAEQISRNKDTLLSDLFFSLLIALIAFIVEANLEVLNKVRLYLSKASTDRLVMQIRDLIDKDFFEIFGVYFNEVIDNIESAILAKKVTISTIQFKEFYRSVLLKRPDTTLYATSLIHLNYFWTDDTEIPKGSVEEAHQRFTNDGGRYFERIFFIGKDDIINIERTKRVFEMQKKIGVHTFVVDIDDPYLDKEHRRLILVSQNKKFGWEVFLGQDSRISHVNVTVDPKEVASYAISIFQVIRKLPSYKSCDEWLNDIKQ